MTTIVFAPRNNLATHLHRWLMASCVLALVLTATTGWAQAPRAFEYHRYEMVTVTLYDQSTLQGRLAQIYDQEFVLIEDDGSVHELPYDAVFSLVPRGEEDEDIVYELPWTDEATNPRPYTSDGKDSSGYLSDETQTDQRTTAPAPHDDSPYASMPWRGRLYARAAFQLGYARLSARGTPASSTGEKRTLQVQGVGPGLSFALGWVFHPQFAAHLSLSTQVMLETSSRARQRSADGQTHREPYRKAALNVSSLQMGAGLSYFHGPWIISTSFGAAHLDVTPRGVAHGYSEWGLGGEGLLGVQTTDWGSMNIGFALSIQWLAITTKHDTAEQIKEKARHFVVGPMLFASF